jgi:WhiB family redox-sensing transcriptional regulator
VDEDPELFFAIGNTGPALLQIEDAKAVCRRCDVIDQCLQWALESGQDAGVWGGMSEDERRALKRRASKQRSDRGTRYGEEIREDAIARYQAIRPDQPSDWAAAVVVANEFGVAKVDTVLKWTSELSTGRKAGPRPDVERRERALELVARVRPYHASEKAACRVVASQVGVHVDTVCEWVRKARAEQRAAVAATQGVDS